MVKFFQIFTFLILVSACSSQSISSYDSNNQILDSTFESNKLEPIISPYRVAVDAQMNTIIGQVDSALLSFKPESPLGNFVADVLFEFAINYDFQFVKDISRDNSMALLNFGGLRAPLNQGEVSIGSIFQIMPFDNTLEIVQLDSAGIVQMLEYLYDSEGQPVANARFNLDGQSNKVTINNKKIQYNQPLFVYTSDYLAGGGDKMNFLRDAPRKWNTGVLLRDIFIKFIERTKEIHKLPIDNRMKIIK